MLNYVNYLKGLFQQYISFGGGIRRTDGNTILL